MREPRAICLACRSKLLVGSLSQTRPQWRSRLALASAAGNSTTAATTAAAALGTTEPHQQSKPDAASSVSPATVVRNNSVSRSVFTGGTRAVSRPAGRGEQSDTLAMFESIVQDRPVKSSLVPSGPRPSMELYNDLAKLQGMFKREDAQTCYNFFSTRILPYVDVGSRIPQIVKENATRILGKVTRAKEEDFENKELPSITEITKNLRDLGLVSPQRWAPLILGLVQHLCSVSTSPDDYTAIEAYENALARRKILLQDLVTAWAEFTLCGVPHVKHRSYDTGGHEFRLPRVDPRRLKAYAKKGDIYSAVARMFPQYTILQLREVTIAAVGTFTLLTDEKKTNSAVRMSARPFIGQLSRILAAVPFHDNILSEMFQRYPELSQYVLQRWPEVMASLQTYSEISVDKLAVRRPGFIQGSQEEQIGSVHKQIGQALRMRYLPTLEQAWTTFWGNNQTGKPEESKIQHIRENPLLFDYFLMAFTAMRRPDRAEQILSCMATISIEPAVNTWTSLMEGCKRARDPVGVETVWRKLLKTGLKLDTACWTARISGLIEAGQPDAGIRALDEMARRWKYAEQTGTTPRAVKPTIEPVNAAIAGLLRLNAVSPAQKVLAWASQHGIEPDIITYNTLLRPMIRQGHSEEVENIFRMMKEQGIQADVATFTIVLDGSLSQLDEQSPERQVETVTRVLSEMEEAGVEANMETYGKMMYLLLREGDKARDSVKAVLAHIWGKGLELSSHIYTILVEHYFSRDPPDLVAVKELIQSRGLVDKSATTDRVFWERVIKGYAHAGDTASAMDIFERIDSSGAAITLSTLEVLLRALVHFRQADEAQKLVDTVLSHRDRFISDTTENTDSRFWRHGFWGFARDNGLMREALP